VGAAILMLGANQIARVTFIQGKLVIPAVVLFVFMGAWMHTNALGDWITLMIFGLLGYLMKQGGFPRPPVILGFILGPIMENALFITNQAYGPVDWLLRPVCLSLLFLVGGTVIYSLYRRRREQDKPPALAASSSTQDDPVVSLAIVILLAVTFLYTTMLALGWHADAAMFPLAAGFSGIVLAILALIQETRSVHHALEGRGMIAAWRSAASTLDDLPAVSTFFFWLVGLLSVTVVAGQRVALPLFILLYLRLSGRTSWMFAIAYAVAGWLFLQLMFERIVHIVWYPSLFMN
jgi:hypothetical protein